MEGFYETIFALWNFFQYDMTYGDITFSFFDVFCAGLIFSLIGYFIGKIILFWTNRR